MRRAAASSVPSTPTGAASTSQTPLTEPAVKRRRIDSGASSPATSTPGTPLSGTNNAATGGGRDSNFGASRGGVSNFIPGEGADTEWVLNLKMTFPGVGKTTSNGHAHPRSNTPNETPSRANASRLDNRDQDQDDEDIWANQPSGRQTFGSFRRKQRSKTQQNPTSDDEDLSSGSEESDSGSGSGSDFPNGPRPDRPSQRTPSQRRSAKAGKDVDSDEEMRQVRRAMEAKHRSMMGTGPTTQGVGGGGQKRSRESGGYKTRKKARQTI